MQMETFTKESGKMVKLLGKVSSLTEADQCTRENGSMISITAKELKPGTMAQLSTKESFKKAKKLERESSVLMATTTRVILSMVNSMERASTILLTLAKSMRETSKRII